MALDAAGNLYVADSGNQRTQVLSTSGTVATLAANGRDIALDPTGNLYLTAGAQILEVAPAGAVSPRTGDGSYLFRGNGGQATSARLNAPVAVAVSTDDALYIADQGNLRVRVRSTLKARFPH